MQEVSQAKKKLVKAKETRVNLLIEVPHKN